jgi:phage FluMu protein Com
MPIDTQCTACGQRLRVADALAGKQVNCPKCKNKVTIPAGASANSAPKATAASVGAANPQRTVAKAQTSAAPAVPVMAAAPAIADDWHLQTPDGQQYGPISKSELDSWLAEDRLTADSQLLPPGGQQWVMAAQVYPSLAQTIQQPVMQQTVMQPQAPQFPSIAPSSMAVPSALPAMSAPTFAPVPSNYAAANPYASPMAPSGGPVVETGDEMGSLAIVRRLLMETRPWALFIAIVGFLYGGLVILMGIFYLGIAAMALGSRGGAAAAAVTGIGALAQLAFGATIIYTFVCLSSFAMRIGEFQRSMSVRTLEGALRAQRSFWRMAGIILATVLGLMVLGFVLLLAGALSLGTQGPPPRF